MALELNLSSYRSLFEEIMENDELETAFDKEMYKIYRAAYAKCKYNAHIFHQMLHDHGGLIAAKRLLSQYGLQHGFESLCECGCADITMESLILREPWRHFFSRKEKEVATDSSIRLKAQLLPESRSSGATEKIKIIATSKEEPLLQGAFKEGFRTWSAKETGLASDLLRRLSQLEPGEWGEATVVYRIAPLN